MWSKIPLNHPDNKVKWKEIKEIYGKKLMGEANMPKIPLLILSFDLR
jgi:hypothetical protein